MYVDDECMRDCRISQIADLQLRFDKLGFKQFITGITGEINSIQEQANGLESQINEIIGSIGNPRDAKAQLDAKIHELKTEIKDIEGKIESLE